MSGGSKISIPKNVQKTIQNIKEIAGNHNDDEIYAMLKECSMDPNETTQKLLLQDPFREVKRKRDRKKESLNKEAGDSRWRPATQVRGGRGTRGIYSSQFSSQDARAGKNTNAGRDNMVNQGASRGTTSTSSVLQDTKNKELDPVASAPPKKANGPGNVAHEEDHAQGHTSQVLVPWENPDTYLNKSGSQLPPSADLKSRTSLTGGLQGHTTPNSDQLVSPTAPSSVSGLYSLATDPVLVPSLDSRIPSVAGTIKIEVGSQRVSAESSKGVSHEVSDKDLSSSMNENVSLDLGNSFMYGKMPNKSLSDSSQPVSTSRASSSSSRPSSNYGSQSQQVIGSQKAMGPSKEWKPKPTNPNVVLSSRSMDTSDSPSITSELNSMSVPVSNTTELEETTLKLQKKLQDLHVSDRHVIIPNHLQVPEAERTGLSFGSFDACFGVTTSFADGHESDKSSIPPSESSEDVQENAEEPSSSNQNTSPMPHEGDYAGHPQSQALMQENESPGSADVSSNISPGADYDQSKLETSFPPGGPQYTVVHTTPNYSSFGLVTPMLGSQFAPFETSEPHPRDPSRLPSFVVQQPFDPSTGYYTQYYRPSADGDGRFSPFLVAPGAAASAKYNGNIAVLSGQTAPGQSPQPESAHSMVLSTAGPALVTQAAGVMQSSMAVTQQPVPVFRQPAGVHISHYPPNYTPYSQYYSPFYVPPPTIHHFLGNTAFPQQPPTGTIYPSPAVGPATAVKYSLSQYKPGTNTSSSTHMGMPTGYMPYSTTQTGYNASPVTGNSSGTSSGNEDLASSQYKENNAYMTGQQMQSEGSAVWIPAPGRDMSGLHASSYYNLPPQGQHLAFAPTQAGHGPFAGIYHLGQSLSAATVRPLLQQSQTISEAVEMVGPPGGVYQQPRAPINWGNNY